MSKKVIEDLLSLLGQGYAPYHGTVDGLVYERLRCHRPEKASWLSHGRRFVCLGCSKRCADATGEGFQAVLPSVRRGWQVAFAVLPQVTVEQLLQAKPLLNVEEAAFVLNVGRTTIYEMIRSGKLDRHPDDPVRVTVASLREELARVAE